MNLVIKLFLENDSRYVLGPGRMELLRAVGEEGSLRKAAQRLGMSYRWAWGRLNDVEKALGIDLLSHGGGSAKTLTLEALALLDWYAALEGDLRAALAEAEEKQPEFLKNSVRSARSAKPIPKKNKAALD